MKVDLTDNSEKKRFEAEVDGQWAFIDYIRTTDKIYLTHTEVPNALEGKGVGSALVAETLDRIKDANLKLMPLCPFVANYVKKHSEYKELLAEGYNV